VTPRIAVAGRSDVSTRGRASSFWAYRRQPRAVRLLLETGSPLSLRSPNAWTRQTPGLRSITVPRLWLITSPSDDALDDINALLA
jgi:hypothetical protein